MVNKQHAQFSDENGNIFYLENETEDVLDPSGKPLSNGGDLSEASVTFAPDATRKLPQSGGRFKAFLGSIVKYLTDLGAAAYLAVANNCTTTQAGSLLDARQGKVLMDKANQLSSERNIFSRSFNYTELVYGSQNFSSGFVIIAKVNRVVIANVDVYFKIGLTPGVAHQILSKSQLVDINCWIPTPTGNQSFAFESIAISGVNKNLAIIGLNDSDNAANGLTIYPLDVPTGVGDHIRHQLIWVSE